MSVFRALAGSCALALVSLVWSGPARAQDEPASTSGEGGDDPDPRGDSAGPTEAQATFERGPHGEQDGLARREPRVGVEAKRISSFGGRRTPIEIELSFGFARTALEPAGQSLAPPSERGGFGGSLAVATGMRSGPLLVGPRFAFVIDPSFVLTHIALGADMELAQGDIVPFVRLALGASFITPLGQMYSNSGAIVGLGGELGVGLRWHLGEGFALGAELVGASHYLWRAAAPICMGRCTEGDFDLRGVGEGAALSARASLLAGYQF